MYMSSNCNLDAVANHPRLTDKKGVAKFLCCSVRLIDDLRKKAGLPFLTVGTHLVRFNLDHVAEWVRQREQNPVEMPDVAKAEDTDSASRLPGTMPHDIQGEG